MMRWNGEHSANGKINKLTSTFPAADYDFMRRDSIKYLELSIIYQEKRNRIKIIDIEESIVVKAIPSLPN